MRASPLLLRAGLLALTFASTSACLRGWELGGPWKCGEGNVCPEGYTCDDKVCCIPGGTPACPTLPAPNGTCPNGPSRLYFQDADEDGHGNGSLRLRMCQLPLRDPGDPAWVEVGDDCDDNNPKIHPGAAEECNGRDDTCDRVIDEGLGGPTFFVDEDGDGAGDPNARLQACMAPPGYVAAGGDCGPNDPAKFPGADELCNNLDDDCDGQPDTAETTFADTDVAGTNRFPCVSSALGVCRPGTFRCEVQGNVVQRVCVPLLGPSREVCDGLDNDCNGAVDEAPKCGGPRSLIGAPGVIYRAMRMTNGTTASLFGSCQANLANTPMTISSDGRTWTGTSAGYFVWSAQAPAGTAWDLSKLDLKLHLKFSANVTTPFTGTGGNWGIPPAGAYNPVVYLCGDNDADYIRYRISSPTNAFKDNDTSFEQDLPLNNGSPIWLVATGSGFDTSRVRRIELMLFTQATDFTITLDGTTGFPP